MRTFYDVLGVSNGASYSEIRGAYRTLALKLHPDKNNNSEESKQRFIELVEAYNILSDEETRKEYDRIYPLDASRHSRIPEQQWTTSDYTVAGFLLYERTDLGICIQYPQDWIIDEKYYNPYDDRFNQVVGFMTRSYDEPHQLQELLSIEIKYLGSNNIEFEAYTKRQMQELMTRHADAFDFILLESSQLRLAGRRAYKIDYIFTYKRKNKYLRSVEFWTIDKDRAYHISYDTYPS
jgi:curved DNA-binding protein CbpA